MQRVLSSRSRDRERTASPTLLSADAAMFFSRKSSGSKENTTASAPNLGASGTFSLKPEEETFPRAPSGGSGLLGLFSSGSASDTSSLTFQRPVQPSAKPKEAPPPEAAKPPPPCR